MVMLFVSEVALEGESAGSGYDYESYEVADKQDIGPLCRFSTSRRFDPTQSFSDLGIWSKRIHHTEFACGVATSPVPIAATGSQAMTAFAQLAGDNRWTIALIQEISRLSGVARSLMLGAASTNIQNGLDGSCGFLFNQLI